MKKFMYKWHRRLALVMAVPILLWALSGVLHPLMSNWFKPEIANKFLRATAVQLDASSEKKVSEICAGFEQVHMIKVISLKGKPVLLVITPDQEQHYRDVATGIEIADGASIYAEQLGRAYLGDQESKLVAVTKIEEFQPGYSYIHRFLPVYRVELEREAGLQVVVDPRTGKLAAYDNGFRRVASKLFSWMHTWSFLGARDSVFRIVVVSLMSLAGLFLALSGVFSWFFMKGKRRMKKGRRWHRMLGIGMVLFYFMFSLSGFFHVVMKLDYDDSDTWVSEQAVSPASMQVSISGALNAAQAAGVDQAGLKELTLAVVDGQSCYRVALMGQRGSRKPGPVVYVNSESGAILEGGEERYAKVLALEFSGYSESDISEVELITSFRAEYGFIFRRMPVWRVHFSGQEYWQYTVDTRDAHMSMRTSTVGLVEALSFINLHKFHFLDFAGKTVRDVVLLVLMGFFTLLTFSGLCLLKKKRAKKEVAG